MRVEIMLMYEKNSINVLHLCFIDPQKMVQSLDPVGFPN